MSELKPEEFPTEHDVPVDPLAGDDPGSPENEEPFDKDLPCIRCGYNLRGLKADGNCPECGARIRKSFNFAMERVLCLACMCPVHPSIPKCPNCGAPMNAAAAISNYWQTTARGVPRRKPAANPPDAQAKDQTASDERLPPKPPSPRIAWLVCSSLAGFFLVWAAVAGLARPTLMVMFVMIAILTLVPALRATRTYNLRWNERQRKIAAQLRSADSTPQ